MKRWAFLAAAALAGCGGDPLYWEPDLTGHECSKTLKTCDYDVEICFEGSCVPKCWSDADCDGGTCEPVSEDLETWRICFASE